MPFKGTDSFSNILHFCVVPYPLIRLLSFRDILRMLLSVALCCICRFFNIVLVSTPVNYHWDYTCIVNPAFFSGSFDWRTYLILA